MPTSLGWSGMNRAKQFASTGPNKKKETYAASIDQSASDYDDIMDRYRKFLGKGEDPRITGLIGQYKTDAARADKPYKRGPDVAASMANLGELSRTGGYSAQGIQDLRARGISPIRSVYAAAQQNLDRNRSLSGGYSPNYAAATSKMAREQSEQISSRTSDVNAGIAQNVASNRLSASPQYAGNAMRETEIINQHNQANQQARAGNLSAMGGLLSMHGNQQLEAIGGLRQTYGTTPANPALYGQQAATTRGLEQEDQRINQSGSGMLMNAYQQPTRKMRPGQFALG